MNKKVIVAMSGGVDSSVSAALLKERGFDVIGITMHIWERSGDGSACCGIGSVKDAKKVAAQLGIRHYVLNFRDIFREKVIANFCAQYQKGRTPNPCIKCNQYIKFDVLLRKTRQLGADYLATGHYARIQFEAQRKRFILSKGIDAQKDQSYVLYTLTQEQLKHTLMPLGELTKARVREIAREKDLAVANKPESQEICFIPNGSYGEFLKANIPQATKPGPIVNKQGKIIGEHQGIIFYTIGQRKGIGIQDKEPLYVMAIKKEDNSIVVGKREEVFSDELSVENVNFIYIDKLKEPLKVKVKVRYLHPASSATLIPQDNDKVKVMFDQPQWAITPGQAAVFYLSANNHSNGDIVIGGGTII